MALLIIRRPGWPEEHVTPNGPILIGRGVDCTVQLADPAVSTRHCRIEPVDEFWQITDLRSRTGTWVGDTQIQSRYLKDIDTIRIAGVELEFHSQTEEEDAPTFAHITEPKVLAVPNHLKAAAPSVAFSVNTTPRRAKPAPSKATRIPPKVMAKLAVAVVGLMIGGYVMFSELSGENTSAQPSVAHLITKQKPGD